MAQNADYRLLQTELNAIREEIRILKRGALPSIGSGDTVLQNEGRIFFSGTGDDAGYIYMSSGNDLTIGNFANGEKILWLVKDPGGLQREITLIVDDTTNTPQITGQEGLRLIAAGTSADISILASGDITIDADGAILLTGLPTSDPHVVNQIWKSGTSLMISAG